MSQILCVSCLGLALTTALASAPVRAAQPAPTDAPKRAAVYALVRAELTRAEARRLLRRRSVREAIEELLASYDGHDDDLTVERDADGIVIRLVARQRGTLCAHPQAGAEQPTDTPKCEPLAQEIDRQELRLGRELWRRPRPRPTPEPPPTPAPAEPAGPPDSVLRNPDYQTRYDRALADLDPGLVELLVAHHEFRRAVARGGFKDPFTRNGIAELATLARPIERGKLLSPPDNLEHRALQNLRKPFSESRMVLGEPYPDLLAPNPMAEPSFLEEPDKACLARWSEESSSDQPPTLACFRTVVRHRRLDKSDVYKAARALRMFIALPVLDSIMAGEVKHAKAELVSGQLWVIVWIEWVRAHPDRMGAAVAQLGPAERATLRPRLRRWWKKQRYQKTIDHLYEEHIATLYPGLRGRDGLPERGRFRDDFLWATNWLSVNERADASLVRSRYDRLSTEDRRVLGHILIHSASGRRFPHAVAALVAHRDAKGS